MAQKEIKYTSKRLVEQTSTSRFVFSSLLIVLVITLLLGESACGEPEIKLTRADRKHIDTLVNHQLDSIGPMLDSLCKVTRAELIQQAVDSIVQERQEKEKRLRTITNFQ